MIIAPQIGLWSLADYAAEALYYSQRGGLVSLVDDPVQLLLGNDASLFWPQQMNGRFSPHGSRSRARW